MWHRLTDFVRWWRVVLIDVGMVVLLLYLVYTLLIAPDGMRLYVQMQRLQAQGHEVLSELQTQVSQLDRQLHLLQDEDVYVASRARMQWGMVKPGERLIWYQQEEDE